MKFNIGEPYWTLLIISFGPHLTVWR